jgi:3-oxoadipate enol-lactonase
VCTSYGGRGPEAISPKALADMLGWGSLGAEEGVRRGLETASSEAYRVQRPEEFEQIVRWRLADSPSSAAYREQALAGARFDVSRDVGHITSPTLVIHGADDRYVPPANAAALAEAIPGARLRVLEDAGHLVFIERHADVNREVVKFLKPRESRERRSTLREGRAGGVGEAFRRASRAVRRLIEGARIGSS